MQRALVAAEEEGMVEGVQQVPVEMVGTEVPVAPVAEVVVESRILLQGFRALAGPAPTARSASGPGRPNVHKMSTFAAMRRHFSYEFRD